MISMDGVEARIDKLRARNKWADVIPDLQEYAKLGAQLASESKPLSRTHFSPNLARAYYWTVLAECHYRQQSELNETLLCIAKALAYSAAYKDCQILLAEILLFEGLGLSKEPLRVKGFAPHSTTLSTGDAARPTEEITDPWALIPMAKGQAMEEDEDDGYETAADEEEKSVLSELSDVPAAEIASVFTDLSDHEILEVSKAFEQMKVPQKLRLLQILQLVNQQVKLKCARLFLEEGPASNSMPHSHYQENFKTVTRLGMLIAIELLGGLESCPDTHSISHEIYSPYRLGMHLWCLNETARLLEQIGRKELCPSYYEAVLKVGSSDNQSDRMALVTSLSVGAFAFLSSSPSSQREVVLAACGAPLLYAETDKTAHAIEMFTWCLDPHSAIHELLTESDQVYCAKHLAKLLEENSPDEAIKVLLDLYKILFDSLSRRHRCSRKFSATSATEILVNGQSSNDSVLLELCHSITAHYLRMNHASEAVEFLEGLLSSTLFAPQDLVMQWWDLADALVNDNRHLQALNALKECEQVLISNSSPRFPSYYPALKAAKICLDHAGDFAQAVRYSEHALDLVKPGETDPKVFYYHGVCLAELARHNTPFAMERKGLQQRALSFLEDAYAISDCNCKATRVHLLAHQAILLGEMGKPGESYTCCQKGLAQYNSDAFQCPSSMETLLLHVVALAIGCAEEDNYTEADRVLVQALNTGHGHSFNLSLSRASLALRLCPEAAPPILFELSKRVNAVLQTHWNFEPGLRLSPSNVPDAVVVEGVNTQIPVAAIVQPNELASFQDVELEEKPALIFEFWGIYISYLISQRQLNEASELVKCADKFALLLHTKKKTPREEFVLSHKVKPDILCQAGWLALAKEDLKGASEKFQLALVTKSYHVAALVGLGSLNLHRISAEEVCHPQIHTSSPLCKQPSAGDFLPLNATTQEAFGNLHEGQDPAVPVSPNLNADQTQSTLYWTDAYNFLVEAIRRDSLNFLAWYSLGALFERADMHIEASDSFLSALDAEQKTAARSFNCASL